MAELANGFGIKILLAEKDLESASLLRALLENYGHVVTHCSDGVSVIDMLMESNFDLIIMNVHMPKIDGIGLSRWIHCMGRNVPLIIIPGTLPAEIKTLFLQLNTMTFRGVRRSTLAVNLTEKIPTNCNVNSLKK